MDEEVKHDNDSTQPFSLPAAEVAEPTTETAEAISWQEGEVILGQYEVRGLLGEGGMGRVYQVYHRGWRIDLAVKSPKAEIFTRAGGKENFLREAETWMHLGLHPHIVSCFYVRTLAGLPHVFAEYVAGSSLADWIRTRRLYAGGQQAALARMLDVAIQIAWGLHYAHEQGVVHQDVKPANVMLTPQESAKVTDFGLAKARTLAGESTDEVAGGQQSILVSSRGRTPAYCSPEQALGKDVSRKTDIWSWGVSILEMFVGEVTWMAGELAGEALARHQRQDPLIPPMPAELVPLLAWCFQPRPQDRPASLLEVATELQTIFAHRLGHPLPRQAPRPAELLADSLNNQALSLYDLGKEEEAHQKWEQALQVDPHHLETTYNRGVALWRQGALPDDALVAQLQALLETHRMQSQGGLARALLAQVHLERAEPEAARALLEVSVCLVPGEPESQKLLERMRSGMLPTGRCLRTFQGHTDMVSSVSLSADGRFALSGGRDQTLRLWELRTGRCLRSFLGHTHYVNAVSLSADGRFALSGSRDRTLRLWELSTGRCLHILQGHTEAVEAVCLSADGRFALSGSRDQTLRLWELSMGRCLHTFQGHTDWVSAVSLSADGRFALSGSFDQTLRLWELSTGRCLHILQGHTGAVSAVSLSADGRLALSGSFDQTLRMWELSTGRCLRSFQGHTDRVEAASLSADGRFALSGGWDQTLRLWELSTGRCLHTFQGHTDRVEAVSLSADGRFALSGSDDQTLRLWELPQRQIRVCEWQVSKAQTTAGLSQRASQATAWLEQARQARQEERFALALYLLHQVRALPGWERAPKSLEAWAALGRFCSRAGLRGGWLAKTLQGHTAGVLAVSLSADGRFALSGSEDETLRLWELSTGHCLHTLQGHTAGVLAVSLSADGRFALSGSRDRTLRLWELSTGHSLRILQGHTDAVSAVSLSADGRFALSGSRDRTLRLWELSTGRCLRSFEGHTDRVEAVCLSADGRFALSGSQDRTLRLWELSTGRCLRICQENTASVNAVSLSADGRFALSGSGNGTLRLWELSTGHCLHTFQGHIHWVLAVSLSADGRFALSGSDDQTLRLWELSTGRCLRSFEGHTHWVDAVSLSADGRFALSGSVDGTLRLWELDWEWQTHDLQEWDEAARPMLNLFLSQHTPFAGTLPPDRQPSEEEIERALTRSGRASWSEEDFQGLIRQLQDAGLGWLRPEGVRRKLKERAQAAAQQAAQAESWLEQARQARQEGRFTLALHLLHQVRALPGWERAPKSLEAWAALRRFCSRAGLRGGWLAKTLQGHTGPVYAVSLSADGRFALSGSEDETLRLWELSTGRCLRSFQGHTDAVHAVSLSADGRFALSGSRDRTLRLWELSTGRCLRSFQGHTDAVHAVSLSADGRLALSGSQDRTLRLWELSTGRCLHILQGHTASVEAVCLSADGRFALSGGQDRTLRLWELSTGRCLRILQGHTASVEAVSLSADGRFALSGSEDRTLRLWELSTGRCLHTLQGHTFTVHAVSLSADGRFALSGSRDQTLRLWELSTGHRLHTLQGHTGRVNAVSLSADGRFALSGSVDGTLRLWELDWEWQTHDLQEWDEAARPMLNLFLSQHTPFAGTLPPDRQPSEKEIERALTRSGRASWSEEDFQGLIRQLQDAGLGWLRPEGVRRKLKERAQAAAQQAAQAESWLEQARQARQEERFALALYLLHQVRALPGWERAPKSLEAWAALGRFCSRAGLRGGWLAKTLQGHPGPVYAVSLSADGRFALSGSGNGTLRLWELSTGHRLHTLQGHTGRVNAVSLSADGRFALSGSVDQTLRLWELSTGRCLRSFQGHTDAVHAVSLSADGRLALSGGRDQTLRLWELSTGRCLRSFQGHTDWVLAVCLSADGRFALSGSEDGTLRLWELSTGRCLHTFQGHTHWVSAVSLSADGRFALSGSYDHTLRLWELSTGRCLRSFEGHTFTVHAVSLSADGRFALSGSRDQTLRLWELSTGRCLHTFQGHTHVVSAVSLSADGRFALSGSEDGTLRLWELDWEWQAHDLQEWDEAARPMLNLFLSQHTPFAGTLPPDRQPSEEEIERALTRSGRASWSEEDFQGLIRQLQDAGLGWLRPEGVRRKLEERAQDQ